MERAMITDPEVYFAKGCGRCDKFGTPDCSTRRWIDGLLDLRRICRAAGLVEEAKWGHPVYTRNGRNIAMIGAFKGDFCLTFMNASLLKDSEGVLEKRGPNTQVAGVMYFRDPGAAAAREATINAYLAEAISYADAGIKPEKQVVELDWPEELIDALDADDELAEAFHALTPGRQKSYVYALNTAKASATRVRRIEKYREKILAGKGALER